MKKMLKNQPTREVGRKKRPILLKSPTKGDFRDSKGDGGRDGGRDEGEGGWIGGRIDLYIKGCIPWRSRSEISGILKEGRILVNGEAVKPSRRIKPGDSIQYIPKEEGPQQSKKWDIPVVFEDKQILVIDKPAGLPCHPTSGSPHENVINLLRSGESEYLSLAHRLDRETSGLLILAKNPSCRTNLQNQIEKSKIKKEYLAIVEGELIDSYKRIDGPIGKAKNSLVYIKRAVCPEEGVPALTEVFVQRRLLNTTLVKACPTTGRQHQIRVHLSSIGFPIVGDKIYGADEGIFLEFLEKGMTLGLASRLKMPRQALHASKLTFMHPSKGTWMSLESPIPDDFKAFLSSREVFS
jgi:23S rRNA pseudouridine1911/1915/1917 synthase